MLRFAVNEGTNEWITDQTSQRRLNNAYKHEMRKFSEVQWQLNQQKHFLLPRPRSHAHFWRKRKQQWENREKVGKATGKTDDGLQTRPSLQMTSGWLFANLFGCCDAVQTASAEVTEVSE